MTRVFFTSESARLAGKRSGEVRRAHKANETNGARRTLFASVAEQEQTSDDLATLAHRLDAKVLRALEQRVDAGKATVTELLAYCDWRGLRPPRRQEVSKAVVEALRLLNPDSVSQSGAEPTLPAPDAENQPLDE
jgi:hypothetical protein